MRILSGRGCGETRGQALHGVRFHQPQHQLLGTVVAAAGTAKGPHAVRVVMFIDQRITNRAGGPNRSDKSRVVMSMVERDGRWLVDDVELR